MPAAHAHITESKLFERLNIRSVIMIIECEVSFTPPNVYLSILQAHAGQIVSLLRVNCTSETLSEPESTDIFESRASVANWSIKALLRWSKTKRSWRTCQMITEVVENYWNEQVGQSPLVCKQRRPPLYSAENHRDYRGRKFCTDLTRIKRLRNM